MSGHGWLILSIVAFPFIGFLLWVFGQVLRARREETETVLRKGLPTEAEITGYAPHLRGATVQYRFLAMGWENPISSYESASARNHVRGWRQSRNSLPSRAPAHLGNRPGSPSVPAKNLKPKGLRRSMRVIKTQEKIKASNSTLRVSIGTGCDRA